MMKTAEDHCSRNAFLTVEVHLAKIVGCSPSTMSKAIVATIHYDPDDKR